MIRPKLTIAIPTYNRQEKLRESLERVIKYSKELDVEILVSDNASLDNTEQVVKEMQKKYYYIKYYRNSENLGFDGNFFNCFEKAKGEYVWLLSDDDILLPGAIESVIECCEKRPVCIHLNTSGIKKEKPLCINKPRFKEEGILEFTDKNAFIEKINIFCTFVSSLVFNVEMVRKIENKEQYFETNILQSHVFFEVMRNQGLYIINTFNCLAARGNDSVSYDVLRTWIKNYSELFLITAPKCGFDANRMSEVLRRGLSSSVYEFVLIYRLNCENEKNWDRDCIWSYIKRYPELVDKYKKIVYCSLDELKRIRYKYKIERKFKNLWEKIK